MMIDIDATNRSVERSNTRREDLEFVELFCNNLKVVSPESNQCVKLPPSFCVVR